ncbi:MAG TPA: flagellar basal body-associated FliL family protein [Conexibacter sp.]|jgi:flagellar basal body-associated protein FliL|nr:flagellar basal body-associated FliL family protein [Conexibacter sp.]
MKRKKILIPLLVVVIAAVAAKFVLARPAPEPHHKIDGIVYVLPKEFLVNLSDGRYAKLNVALVLDPSQPTAAAGGEGGGASPPDGFGPLEQEAAVRDIVTDVVTGQSGDELVSARGRRQVKAEILAGLRAHTDVRVNEVLLPDVAVQ